MYIVIEINANCPNYCCDVFVALGCVYDALGFVVVSANDDESGRLAANANCDSRGRRPYVSVMGDALPAELVAPAPVQP